MVQASFSLGHFLMKNILYKISKNMNINPYTAENVYKLKFNLVRISIVILELKDQEYFVKLAKAH